MNTPTIYTATPADLSPPVQTDSFCVDLVLATDYQKLKDEFAALAAENVAMKAGVAEEIEVINRGGQMYCVKDGMSINPIYARGWNDHRANLKAVKTPATDRIVAWIKAEGAEACVRALVTADEDDDFVDAPNICAMVAFQLREGAK